MAATPEFSGFYTVDIFDCPPFQMFTVGDDPRSYDIRRHRRFEPHSMKLWCMAARKASCILDIGAHTGIYALAAASIRNDIPVWAFEPHPFTAARLRLHRQVNGFENLSDRHVALFSSDGVIELMWSQKQSDMLPSGSKLGHSAQGFGSPVYARRLDSFDIAYGTAPLVKIDVEGAEAHVLRAATRLLEARPVIILESFDKQACTAIAGMLPGYRFADVIESGGVQWSSSLQPSDENSPNANHLCVPFERAADFGG